MKAARDNGVHYAVPKGTDSLAVIVNSALFEKYGVTEPENGWTWDDMLTVCGELKTAIEAAGDSIYPMDFILNSANGAWEPVIYEFGGQAFNEDGTSALASDEAVAGIQALVDMIDEGYIPDYQTISVLLRKNCSFPGTDMYAVSCRPSVHRRLSRQRWKM